MINFNDFYSPRSSYQRPVPLVLCDPCDDPDVTIRVRREWVPYILGSLKQLLQPTTWDTTDPEALALVQARAQLLLSCVATAFNDPECDCGCAEYRPSANIINWLPQNPYTDPDLVPVGYRFPPWYIVGNDIPFTGLRRGDVLTDLLHGPIVEPISSGFPRFQVTVHGTGTVEFEFVRFPTAGVALITVDGDIFSAQFVDLHMSLAASVGNAIADVIIPIQITQPGEHIVEVAMVFSFTEDPPFVHFGGALRSVSLCGFGKSPSTLPATQVVSLMEYAMPVCTDLRWYNGKLQGLCCFNPETGEMEWVDIQGQDDGVIPNALVQPSSGSRPAAGASRCYVRSLQAKDAFLLPFAVQNGDIVTVTGRTGAWSSDGANWVCTDGTPFILGQCVGNRYHFDEDPDATLYHGQLTLKVGGQYLSATDGPVTLSGLSGSQQLIVMPNFEPELLAGGTVQFQICVENGSAPPVEDWCYVMDLTATDWGAVFYDDGDGPRGQWVLGSGFTPNAASGYEAMIQWQMPEFAETVLTSISVVVTEELDGTSHGVSVDLPAVGGTEYTDFTATDLVYEVEIDPPGPTTAAFIAVADDPGSGVTPYTGFVTQIIWRGQGTNPFGASNC